MKNYLMIMDLVLIAIIKIIFVSVDRKIVLVLLLEKALDGGWRNKLTKTLNLLARPRGFEPLTLGLEMWWLILSPLFHAICHTLLSIITVTNIDDYYYLKCILYRIPCLVLWLCCDSIIQGLFFSNFLSSQNFKKDFFKEFSPIIKSSIILSYINLLRY